MKMHSMAVYVCNVKIKLTQNKAGKLVLGLDSRAMPRI